MSRSARTRRWKISGLCNRQRFLIGSGFARMRLRRLSMQKTCWKIPEECCTSSVMPSVSSLANRCFPGRRACATPTASGRSIGTRRWQGRPRFDHIGRCTVRYRSACEKLTSAAGSVTKGCMNIACVEPRMLPDDKQARPPHSQNQVQPLNRED